MSTSEGMKADDRGFFDPETNTFYKVKNEGIYLKVLEFLNHQRKIKEK